MPDFLHLVGAEDVRRAAAEIHRAAEMTRESAAINGEAATVFAQSTVRMLQAAEYSVRAADVIREALERHQRWMEDWLMRQERMLEADREARGIAIDPEKPFGVG